MIDQHHLPIAEGAVPAARAGDPTRWPRPQIRLSGRGQPGFRPLLL